MGREDIGKEIVVLSHKIRRRIDQTVSAYGMTGIQSRIIGYIYRNADVRHVFQKDIEDEFDIRRSSVTSVLQLLEKNGFIKRECVAEDARLKKVTLTKKGVEVHNEVRLVIQEMEGEFHEVLTPEEISQFFTCIEKLSNVIKD